MARNREEDMKKQQENKHRNEGEGSRSWDSQGRKKNAQEVRQSDMHQQGVLLATVKRTGLKN